MLQHRANFIVNINDSNVAIEDKAANASKIDDIYLLSHIYYIMDPFTDW